MKSVIGSQGVRNRGNATTGRGLTKRGMGAKLMELGDYEDYINQLIKDGYVTENLTPIKCQKCEGNNFDMENIYKQEFYVVEYDLKCVNCGTVAGHFAYGNWGNV